MGIFNRPSDLLAVGEWESLSLYMACCSCYCCCISVFEVVIVFVLVSYDVSISFVLVEALHPSQQFFSHGGAEPQLPEYYQYCQYR